METQNQTTTAQASTSNACPSLAEAMKTATISDETRAYLILIGKLHDLYDEAIDVVGRNIRKTEIDDTMEPYYNGLSGAIQRIEELMLLRMSESYGMIAFHEHRQL